MTIYIPGVKKITLGEIVDDCVTHRIRSCRAIRFETDGGQIVEFILYADCPQNLQIEHKETNGA